MAMGLLYDLQSFRWSRDATIRHGIVTRDSLLQYLLKANGAMASEAETKAIIRTGHRRPPVGSEEDEKHGFSALLAS